MSLFRKKPPVPAQPVEFEFMPPAEWVAFHEAVAASARRLQLPVESFEPGALVVRDAGQLGLLNLAQLCHANERSEWREIIDRHLRLVTERAEIDTFTPAQLRVRLYPDDYGPLDRMVWRPYAESVIAVIVIDLPTMVRGVGVDELATAGIGVDEAWTLAWAQTRTSERPDDHDVVEINGATLHSLLGESIFTASLVEFLPELIGDVSAIGEHGALVSIPRRHTILAHVIRDLSVVEAIQVMIPETRRLFSEGPGSTSAHLYWWRDARLTWLPTSVSDESIEFHPPEDFIELLNSLGPRTL